MVEAYEDATSVSIPSGPLDRFVVGLPISAVWKQDSYNSILVIVDRLTKRVYYEPVKVTINAPGLAKVMLECRPVATS